MKISAINAYKVVLPFKFTFSHSQKDARSVDNIVVEILTYEDGLRGYGEGGPRPYVTGETQDTAIRDVQLLCLDNCFPWDLSDVSQIWQFVDTNLGKRNHNTALCALEMALLDLLATKEGRNILHYLPEDYATDDIRYGAIVPIADEATVTTICRMMKAFDIKEIRLKMGRDIELNRRTAKAVRKIMDGRCNLRVDVNGAWDLDTAKQHLPLLMSYQVGSLEQPLMPNDAHWKELAEALRTTGIKLMADESVCSIEDMEKAITEEYFDLVNVRLSKCGGFYGALKIIQQIRDAGLRYQVGCQLGESGILSAAGRALCAVTSDALYCDGSYDTFLLRENLTTEDVAFGHGGRAAPLKGRSFGIAVDKKSLRRFSEYYTTTQEP
jgi:muconate cycloisomerase